MLRQGRYGPPQNPVVNERTGVARLPLFHADGTTTWTLLDASDLHLTEPYRWERTAATETVPAHVTGRTRRTQMYGPRATVKLHRMLVGAKRGQRVEHRNGDPFDNRRRNIRLIVRAVREPKPMGRPNSIPDADLIEDIEWMTQGGTTSLEEAAARTGLSESWLRKRLLRLERRDLYEQLTACLRRDDAA